MAYTQSPFAEVAGYDLPYSCINAGMDCNTQDRSTISIGKSGLGRSSCIPAFSYGSAYTSESQGTCGVMQRNSLPVPSGKMDLDLLLAAAACKPGYGKPLDTFTASGEANKETQFAADVSAVLQQYDAIPIPAGCSSGIAQAALDAIEQDSLCDTFYVYDLGEVARLHKTWVSTMPRVMPFYAVKCNPEPGVVAMLNALGAGFDCASIQELKCAAAHDVPQDRIIFANPCKRPADFRYAAEHGVQYTTFDCASELEKIAAGYPAFKCVLRIRCDDAEAKINLGLKYGADLSDVPDLLALAKKLGLQVAGVSFHVGSGCQNVGVYADAISAARQAFDLASAAGFHMELLDIGGGFTAPYDEVTGRLFYQTAGVINAALTKSFPLDCGVRVIAEPGRYFAETSATLFTTILGQRDSRAPDGSPFRDYWLSDGTYGSFRIQVAVDGLEPNYSVLRSPLLPPPTVEENAQLLACRLWGNSDRDGDVVHKAALLPPLRDGDWLMFPYAGAYTICAASNYGGVCFTQPQKIFVYSSAAVREYGTFDVAAGAAAATAACRVVVSRVGSIGVVGRKESMPVKDVCDDSNDDAICERLLPCVELLQSLTVAVGDTTDDAGMACILEHELAGIGNVSCVDLEDLDAATAAAVLSGTSTKNKDEQGMSSSATNVAGSVVDDVSGDNENEGLVALRVGGSVGSSEMDCMSVVSDGTCIGCGGSAGDGEVSYVADMDAAYATTAAV